MQIAGAGLFTHSAGLNITATSTGGVRTHQPLSSASVNPTPGHKRRAATKATMMGIHFEMETITSNLGGGFQEEVFISRVQRALGSRS